MQHQRKCVPLTVSIGTSFGRSKLLMQERHVETRTRTNCRQRMLRRFCVCIVDLYRDIVSYGTALTWTLLLSLSLPQPEIK